MNANRASIGETNKVHPYWIIHHSFVLPEGVTILTQHRHFIFTFSSSSALLFLFFASLSFPYSIFPRFFRRSFSPLGHSRAVTYRRPGAWQPRTLNQGKHYREWINQFYRFFSGSREFSLCRQIKNYTPHAWTCGTVVLSNENEIPGGKKGRRRGLKEKFCRSRGFAWRRVERDWGAIGV